MATVYKIHPAIGIARVGNSPDEFFIGPQRPGEYPMPVNGFKDAQYRVKRQAAKFHIFAHHDDGTVEQITNLQADIAWKVHLVNKKAANTKRRNIGNPIDLTIDPGPRVLTAADQRQIFDTGTICFSGGPRVTVPLGEIRSDEKNNLLVLGGFGQSASPTNSKIDDNWGNKNWFDDVSDGPVNATITLHATGLTIQAVSAWVIVAPPKFAPHLNSVITLYDRIFQALVDENILPKPTATSYTEDIHPILQRARDSRWVAHVPAGAMTWPDPVMADDLRNAIFNSLKTPGGGGGDSPRLNDSGTRDDRLTKTQYDHMKRWKENLPENFKNDWSGISVPQQNITPEGLDRAALEACVGAPFNPGVEAGGRPGERPILKAANYSEPFRLKETLLPGDITEVMVLPWQSDFFGCITNWWPAARPNAVLRQGIYQGWTAGIVGNANEMIDKWSVLGFVVKNGDQQIETENNTIQTP